MKTTVHIHVDNMETLLLNAKCQHKEHKILLNRIRKNKGIKEMDS